MLGGHTFVAHQSDKESGLPPQSMVQWLVTLFLWNFYYPNFVSFLPLPTPSKRKVSRSPDWSYISDPFDSTSLSAGITGMCHHSLLQIMPVSFTNCEAFSE